MAIKTALAKLATKLQGPSCPPWSLKSQTIEKLFEKDRGQEVLLDIALLLKFSCAE